MARKYYSQSEKESYKKGYWKGFFIGRKNGRKKNKTYKTKRTRKPKALLPYNDVIIIPPSN